MSKWTGKCDFCDDCEMIHNPQEIIEKSEIYLGDAKIEIKDEKDLIPYYTHLVSSAYYSRDGNSINLSKESFIDIEEKEFLSWKIIRAIKYARKAKKENVDFTFNYLTKQKGYWFNNDNEIWKMIIDIINNNRDLIKIHIPNDNQKALYYMKEWVIPNYFNEVHDSTHNRYRKEFIMFVKEKGYTIFTYKSDENKPIVIEGNYRHRIIDKMGMKVAEYEKMMIKYGKGENE